MADIQPTQKTTHTYQPYTQEPEDKTAKKLDGVIQQSPFHFTAALQEGKTPLSKRQAKTHGDDLSKRIF